MRVLIEIRDDPDEIALAEESISNHGWPIRPCRPGEGRPETATPSHVARIVEVRLLGMRRGIAAQAAHELDHLAARAGLALLVRETVLIHKAETPVQGWEIAPVRLSWRDRVLGLWDAGAVYQPEGFIRAPGGATASPADSIFMSPALSGRYFNPSEHRLRRLRPSRLPKTTPALLALGLATAVSWWGMLRYLDPLLHEHQGLLGVWYAANLSLTFLIALLGLRHAVRYSSTVRHALPWVLPLTLPAMLAGIPRIGSVVQSRYLSHFAFPDSTVTTGWTDSLRAGMFTTLFALAGLALGLGTGGVIHRLSARAGMPFRSAMGMGAFFGTLAAVILAVTAVGRADTAAANDQRALASGHTPAAFYGLEAAFVCARTTTKAPPVYGAPLPTARPLVTYGPEGDRISLWDPETKRSLSMRLEDASFVPARTEHGRAECPQAR
ncbi:hypothetical protein ACFXKC_43540 [Streptomyces sp. NPDC059340]|uniref:hypothetical protein n=1 Tax=Streptomyces sp. NPDC059340 TaxID=3346806 RepID=UPI0036B6EC9B